MPAQVSNSFFISKGCGSLYMVDILIIILLLVFAFDYIFWCSCNFLQLIIHLYN